MPRTRVAVSGNRSTDKHPAADEGGRGRLGEAAVLDAERRDHDDQRQRGRGVDAGPEPVAARRARRGGRRRSGTRG